MATVQNKLIVLDRDGVINQDSDAYIKSEDEWVPIPGSIEAIATLCQQGFRIAVATNQSGLGRGLFDLDDLEAMHAKLCNLVEEAGGVISAIFYCPHTPDDNCECRKPKAGLLDAIASELDETLEGAFLVGDSLRDLEAGASKSCRLALVKTGKGQKTLEKMQQENHSLLKELAVFDDLAAFCKHLS